MEIFIDGGLFEFIAAIAFGYAINFIFLRKYLLIIYSVIAITCPIILYFFNSGEIHNWILGICVINAIFLVLMLWKHRIDFPGTQLINIQKLKNKLDVARVKKNLQFVFKKLTRGKAN